MHASTDVTISHNMDTRHATNDDARAIDAFGMRSLIALGGMIIPGIMGASMTAADGECVRYKGQVIQPTRPSSHVGKLKTKRVAPGSSISVELYCAGEVAGESAQSLC
jgi:hypothetical protein